MKIANPKGTWLVNVAQFRFIDPESDTAFEPGEPTKATYTAWAKGQPAIERCDDPSKAPAEPEPEAPAEAKEDKK